MENLKKFIKRATDIILSLIGLIILSPVLVIFTIIIRVKLGSPVIYKQRRPGKNEKIFTLYKFRSMTNEKDEDGRLLPDSKRLTKLGKFLRKSSIDELPELFNILMGDMSFVGPRPLSIHYLPSYNSLEKKRHNVRPGLTGLAQISGRNDLNWGERFKLDIQYVENISLVGDIKIFFSTFLKVFKSSGISVRGEGAVKDFNVYRLLEEEGDTITTQEIGSCFHLEGGGEKAINKVPPQWLPKGEDNTYTFSGRTAIGFAIDDIKTFGNGKIETVYMPDYSCISMVQPFLDRGIKVHYYKVEFNHGLEFSIDENFPCDIFFAMSYFGLGGFEIDEYIEKFSQRGIATIEDTTHRIFCKNPSSGKADYYIASLYKGIAIPTGGYLAKTVGKLASKPHLDGEAAAAPKIQGMVEKRDFLLGKGGDKKEFLEKFANFTTTLIHLDKDIEIDFLSAGILQNLNISEIIEIRKENAQVLYSGLKDLEGIKFLFPNPDFSIYCPIFVPIILQREKRDSLRKHLINNGVFCPVHWNEAMGGSEQIQSRELSLICDQRYGIEDMERIVNLIKSWHNKEDYNG